MCHGVCAAGVLVGADGRKFEGRFESGRRAEGSFTAGRAAEIGGQPDMALIQHLWMVPEQVTTIGHGDRLC